MADASHVTLSDFEVRDIRFPTHLEADGSDAMHSDPDYSTAYLILKTDSVHEGHGFAFTLGRGTEVVVTAITALCPLVIGHKMADLTSDFAATWRRLTSDSQLRWIGPEKGAIHVATAAVVNAIWDLWAKLEGKPVWKLLVDMSPEQLVSCIDFRYITDFLTKHEAMDILRKANDGKEAREAFLKEHGSPSYTTQVGWLGYSDEKLRSLCKEFLGKGFTKFKIKVGADLNDDLRRCGVIREEIGAENTLMMDANQRWDVGEAIEWMKALAHFKPLWIEEPTSPDDVLGHAAIAKALRPLGIKVATGEQCQNRVLFKQFLQADGLQFCQIDGCKVGGVNENLAIILMAAKANVPVCPHAGGVGLCELVQHLAAFDFIAVSGTQENRVVEFVDHLHQHFVDPVVMKASVDGCRYMPPSSPGHSTEMKKTSRVAFQYPDGDVWREIKKKEAKHSA